MNVLGHESVNETHTSEDKKGDVGDEVSISGSEDPWRRKWQWNGWKWVEIKWKWQPTARSLALQADFLWLSHQGSH